jgi:hypothetical protein
VIIAKDAIRIFVDANPDFPTNKQRIRKTLLQRQTPFPTAGPRRQFVEADDSLSIWLKL